MDALCTDHQVSGLLVIPVEIRINTLRLYNFITALHCCHKVLLQKCYLQFETTWLTAFWNVFC